MIISAGQKRPRCTPTMGALQSIPGNSGPPSGPQDHHELKIIELRAETYNGMVRLLKPGYRSIILLTDNETRDRLLPSFIKAVWPYRRNKTLLFGYLCLDKNILWYKLILEQVTGLEDLNVNKRNCIGTVLSLNGFKKYFRIYHAKLREVTQYERDTLAHNNGSLFDQSDDEELDEEDIESCTVTSPSLSSVSESLTNVDNLLDRLPSWLDRIFEGLTTKRYFLDCWPEDIN